MSVFDAFLEYGPAISTRGNGQRGGGGNNMTFADLTGWSADAAGQPQSFLSTEENFSYVKSLEEKNLVVPVSGDFGGPKAIRAIGAYLRAQGGVVSAFYLSNVEQYLFQDRKTRDFLRQRRDAPDRRQERLHPAVLDAQSRRLGIEAAVRDRRIPRQCPRRPNLDERRCARVRAMMR